jgi:ABC-type phosphate/phosphonate transport system substrate-binding protein
MDWDNPEHRKILELEGLRRWVSPHLDGYKPLFAAVEEQGIDPRW